MYFCQNWKLQHHNNRITGNHPKTKAIISLTSLFSIEIYIHSYMKIKYIINFSVHFNHICSDSVAWKHTCLSVLLSLSFGHSL